ncbi:hypothetical protein AAV99_07960 [Aurantiacibacter marinus]|uniref:Uncharacterized protein n=2 Tax=Aurantiacibacter marinus TaxID=874156 RepID=A0A0H0XNY2_9SPHN|nr:hypothetical protein AAV99_07960 [Aurantiacibacter marinus]
MLVGLIAVAVFIVILNGFAAGVVAAVYFWRNSQGVMKRAFTGALSTGLACLAMLSGSVTNLGDLGEGVAIGAFVLAICFAFGTLVSLPGAYILSRKIGDDGRVNPEVFS